jgi:hypothetical protein
VAQDRGEVLVGDVEHAEVGVETAARAMSTHISYFSVTEVKASLPSDEVKGTF